MTEASSTRPGSTGPGSTGLDRDDLYHLARLHGSSLDDSLFSRLGPGLLERYYRFIETSGTDEVIVERGSRGAVTGAAILSFAPSSLMSRFIARHPIRFAAATAGRLLADGTFRQLFASYLRELFSKQASPLDDGTPEVLQIYAEPDCRGQGIGSRLMARAEQHTRRRGAPRLAVRTQAQNNEPVLRFYENLGYRRRGEAVFCGETYVGFVKDLNGRDREGNDREGKDTEGEDMDGSDHSQDHDSHGEP